ncbi:ribokinase [Candidatus Chlorohelix sp.]|uniref:ribokinase n=1 Tax=Candidatus Chlorohelix sp. TaxID=3139201 RepID=UPI003051E5B6
MIESNHIEIVVVGSLNMDLVVRSPHLPVPGETILGNSFATYEGGKGFNQAIAARRAGGQVAFVGKVGRDDFGDRLEEALKQEGILRQFVTRGENSTGIANVWVGEDGANKIIVVPGTNNEVTPKEIEAASELLSSAGVLLLQLEIPIATCTKAAQLVRRGGGRVLLTAAPVPIEPLPVELFEAVSLLMVNENEALQMAALLGMPIFKEGEEIEAGRSILTQVGSSLEAIVITLGSKGALWISSERVEHSEGFKVKAVDTTAAGDTFTGALAVGLQRGLPVPELLRFANAAGAISVTRKGAYPSIPYEAEIDRLHCLLN